MADFAPNVTPRYKAHYRAAKHVHVIQFRGVRGSTFANMELLGTTHAHALFNALAPNLFDDFAWISAEIALTDSDFFFPAATPTAVTGAQLLANASAADEITHITFSGRGSLGSRVSLHVYGTNFDVDTAPPGGFADFIISAAENAAVAAALATLPGVPTIVAIDNSGIAWRQQVTLKLNDYWLRVKRKGG